MSTEPISKHYFRRRARRKERELQALLDAVDHKMSSVRRNARAALQEEGVPHWAKGVKVISWGRFQHAVIPTAERGH